MATYQGAIPDQCAEKMQMEVTHNSNSNNGNDNRGL